MVTTFRKMALVLSVMCIIAFASPMNVFASLDDLSSGSTVNVSSESEQTTNSRDENSIGNYLQGYTPVTNENMETASKLASPIVNAIGTFSGFIVMCVSAGIFAVTALDLAYIGLPFTRTYLNPKYGMAGGGAMGAPMGGMGMGMGMRGGMMGGMGAMGGGAQQAPESGFRKQWVSDEAVFCVDFASGQTAQAGGGMGAMGGMGMAGMGGMGMGGMQPQAQQMSTKSVIYMYLKKRIFFLIIFALASVILMSSVFTDCGINLAELLAKVMDKVNGQITTFNP